jgi:hypothetical protein
MSESRKPFKLADIPKKDVYRTPEGYFDSLQGRIEARIDSAKKDNSRTLDSSSWMVRYGVAAAVLFAIMWFIGSYNSTP